MIELLHSLSLREAEGDVLDALAAPGIDDVDGAVTAFDYGGVGVLAHG